MIRIRVLGSLEAAVAGDVIDLGGRRQRSVLALLLVARGDVVSVDRMIDDLWRGEPPPRALAALQAYVSNLRRLLEPGRPPRTAARSLISRAPGYAVRLDADAVDAWGFNRDVRAAAAIGDAAKRSQVLETALGRWGGPAFAEFTAEPWAVAEAGRLEQLRLTAREQLAAAVLEAGEPERAGAEAAALTREHPLREEGWRLLAMAQYAAGRQADALSALRQARGILADELGLDPGPALVRLESDILAQRIPVAAPPAAPSTATVTVTTTARVSKFVGRESEREELRAAARDASAGAEAPRVALISGEAGSGKSALLHQLRIDLEAEGWRVAVGRCPEAEGAPPAWAWVEALRALATDVDPGEHAAALAPLLDDRVVGARNVDVDLGRFRLHQAVTKYLNIAAQERPLALIIDDLHRADAETVALLKSVAGTAAVFLAVAYRPDELGPLLEDALAGVAGTAAARIRLGGLGLADAGQLVQAIAGVQPDAATLAALTARTGGNPFYLRESARLLGSEGELVATSEVPEGVRDVLRRRFARLPEVAVSVLRLAAVIGRTVDIEVLLAAVEVDDDTALDAVEAGVLAGLLDEPGPGTIGFTHVLVRDALLGDLPRLRRSRWHARVAEALERLRPDDTAALAHHFGESLSTATARRAADYALDAATTAEGRFAHDAANGHYGQALAALDRLPKDATVDERVDVLARLSRSRNAAGVSMQARQARENAATLAERANRPDLLVRALTAWDTPTPWINRNYGVVDDYLVGLIETALRTPEVSADARCRLLTALVDEICGVRVEQARAATIEAVSLARQTRDPRLLGLALTSNTQTLMFEEDRSRDENARLAEELIELGQRDGIPACTLIGHYVGLLDAAPWGELDKMRAHLDASTQLADRYGWGQAQAQIQLGRFLAAIYAGDLDEAELILGQVGMRSTQYAAVRPSALTTLAMFTIRSAQHRLGELEAALHDIDFPVPDVTADLLALSLVANGKIEQARRTRADLKPIRHDKYRSLFLTIRGRAVTALGEVDEAPAVYSQLLVYRGQIGGGASAALGIGPTDTVLGDLARLQGDTSLAVDHYAVALELALRCGCPQWIDEARTKAAH